MFGRHLLLLCSAFSLLAACGGGGSSSDPPPAPPWPQFRNDGAHTGGSAGLIQTNPGAIRFAAVDDAAELSAIVASPAVDVDGTIYVGSTAGTLRAFRNDDLSVKWTATECARCCPSGGSCDPTLGPLVASPSLFRTDDETNITVADTRGRLYRFTVDETVADPQPVCAACFSPTLESGADAAPQASFRSSPVFTFNSFSANLASTLIGAEIAPGPLSPATSGKVYSVNADGSLRWEFPAQGEPEIGPVTSTPSLGIGGSVIFVDGDDFLYVLASNGALRRRVSIASLTAPDSLLQPTVASSVSMFLGTAGGEIYAFNQDGSFRWNRKVEGERILSSVLIGLQAEPTPTAPTTPEASPTDTPTPDPAVPTDTPTPTPTAVTDFSTVIAVTESGRVIFTDATNGDLVPPTTSGSILVEAGRVLSSPALSLDLYLTFASSEGRVYSIDTSTGGSVRFCSEGATILCENDADCANGFCSAATWPVELPLRCTAGPRRNEICASASDCPASTCARAGIVSSPAIDDDGVIYIGSEDGYLYAIGATGTPAPNSTPTPTPTATQSAAAAG